MLFGQGSDLIVHSRLPFNAEPKPELLRASFITPREAFYVRCHGAIPALDADTHRLRVGGRVATPLDLSMQDLRARFPERSVLAVLQCAGNRRADMNAVRPVSGDPWEVGAIGNAAWTGVALADVLRAAGAGEGETLHVAFQACDECDIEGERLRFGVSIPLAKALSADVLLAWAMNGKALAPEHGFPLRAVVPGWAGVRSAKWLQAITVRKAPLGNHVQARDYKLVAPDVTKDTVDWTRGVTIDEMPLNAAICEPQPDARLAAGKITLRGWAMASRRSVVRVDVSADGGDTWRQAALELHALSPWTWTFWEATLDLGPGEHELVARAWDSAGQTQPEATRDVWNFKGYLSAAWHRVKARVG